MRPKLILIVLATAISIGTSLAWQGATPPMVRVEGTVLDGITGQPLAGATVMRTPTDAQGRFAVEVPTGISNLTVNKEGYRPARLEGRRLSGSIPMNNGIPLNLVPDQKVTGLVVKLFPPAVVTGKVFDHRGQPLQDAEVLTFIYLYNEAGTRYRFNINPSTQRTNDLGEFRIANLDAGDYYFEVRPSSPDLGGTSGMVLAPVFYPNALDPARADVVRVQAGQTNHLGNISAVAVRGAMIRFRLINQIGEAPRGTAGVATLFRGEEFATSLKSEMRPHDQIGEVVEFGRYPAGTYFFRAGMTSFSPGIKEGRVKIELAEKDVQIDIPVVKFLPSTISGRAIIETSGGELVRAVPNLRLAFFDIGANTITTTQRNTVPVALTSGPDGSFAPRAINSLTPPYAYRLRVLDIPRGLYVSAIRGGDPNHFAPESGRETSFTVVMSEGAVSIQGMAFDANKTAVNAGVVALIPEDPRLTHRIATAVTDLEGRFSFQAGPGDYRLYAWREMIGAAYLNADFMAKYRDKGIPVRIGPNGQLTALNVTVLED